MVRASALLGPGKSLKWIAEDLLGLSFASSHRLRGLFCQLTNVWRGHSFPPKLKMSTLADVLDQPGPETGDALAPRVPDTPIKDSVGSVFQKRGGAPLGIFVSIRAVVGRKLAFGRSNVMKLGAEPRDVVPKLYTGFENADLSQLLGFVERDLALSRLNLEPSIPGPAC
jgi:hypothetical protein